MCGIAGIFDPEAPLAPADAEAGRKMSRALIHRGPDEEGWQQSPHLVFAHRRLSIIDLSSGQQPMVSRDKNHTLVFNGEIYNFRELRRDLEAAGHAFATHSDTEVILIGYREWGRALVEKLRGMFAFVLHDARANLIFGARDPIGKKPLYFARRGSKFFFASELGSLCAGGAMDGRLSPEGVDLYFSLGYIPAPHTVYADAHKLCAAQAFTCSSRGLETWTYWDCAATARQSVPEPEARQQLAGLLDGAVERRLLSEVPLGAFLSGGIDSNLVVSSMAKVSLSPVQTFTVGFGGKSALAGVDDEREAAARAAAYYGARHESLEIASATGDLLPELLEHLGEPLADPSIFPTYLVCRAARRRVTVALTGDGGDEPFGGYSFRYGPHLWEEKIRRFAPDFVRAPGARLLHGIWPAASGWPRWLRLQTLWRNLSVSPLEAFLMDQSPRRPGNEVGAAARRRRRPALEWMRNLFDQAAGLDPLSRLLYVDTRLYLCENVLVKADRMSMANSLELRAPLLDQDLVAFAFTLPAALKFSGSESKVLLRNLARERVEPGICNRPKTGFSFPVESSMRQAWRGRIEENLFAGEAIPALREQIPEADLRAAWKRFLAGDNTHQQYLWSAYVFAVWYRRVHAARFKA